MTCTRRVNRSSCLPPATSPQRFPTIELPWLSHQPTVRALTLRDLRSKLNTACRAYPGMESTPGGLLFIRTAAPRIRSRSNLLCWTNRGTCTRSRGPSLPSSPGAFPRTSTQLPTHRVSCTAAITGISNCDAFLMNTFLPSTNTRTRKPRTFLLASVRRPGYDACQNDPALHELMKQPLRVLLLGIVAVLISVPLAMVFGGIATSLLLRERTRE